MKSELGVDVVGEKKGNIEGNKTKTLLNNINI